MNIRKELHLKRSTHQLPRPGRLLSRAVSTLLILLLSFQPLVLSVAEAQVILDPRGNVGQAPSVRSQRGAPVVDITRPNAGGVSVNQFSAFNVDEHGLVLNNATGPVSTTLAGRVAANPNLHGGPAQVIVAEVTGSGGSQISGTTEVAGARADVIIANPNGITCNGCNFLNTRDATLTSGRPIVSGDLITLDVTSGEVRIGREGLDAAAAGTDRVRLVGRAVIVDGRLTAVQRLDVIGGAGRYEMSSGRTAVGAGHGTAPVYAIDASAFGAMRAGQISIVGTEGNLGVRSFGALDAQSGAIALRSGGDLEVASVRAEGAITVRVAGEMRQSGDISSNRMLDFNLGSYHGGEQAGLFGAQDVTILTRHSLRFDGEAQSYADIRLAAGGAVALGGYLRAGGAVTLDGAAGVLIDNATVLAPGGITLAAAQGMINLNAGYLDASEGAITGTSLDLRLAGTMVFGTDSSVTLTARRDFYNAADLRLFERVETAFARDLINESAGIIAEDRLDLDLNGRLINAGQIIGETRLDILATALENQASGIIVGLDGSINLAGALHNAGQISLEGDLSLSADAVTNFGDIGAATLDVEAASYAASAEANLMADTLLTLTTAETLRNAGTIGSLQDLRINAAGLLVNTGSIAAHGDVSILAASIDNAGLLEGWERLTVASRGGLTSRGTISGAADVLLAAADAMQIEGDVQAGVTLSLTALSLVTGRDSSINANKIRLSLRQAELNGVVTVNSSLEAVLPGGFIQNGDLSVLGHMSLAAGEIHLGAGSATYAAQGFSASAEQGLLLGAGAEIQSSGDVALSAAYATLERGATVFAGAPAADGQSADANLNLQIRGLLGLEGAFLQSTADMAIRVGAAAFDLQPSSTSQLVAQGSLILTTDSLRTGATLLQSGRELRVATTGRLEFGNGARLSSAHNLELTGHDLRLVNTLVEAADNLAVRATGDLTLSNADLVAGGADLRVSGRNLWLSDTSLSGAGAVDLTVQADLNGRDIQIVARQDLQLLANSIDLVQTDLVANDGLIAVSAQAGALVWDGSMASGTATSLAASGTATLAGAMQAKGTISVAAGAIVSSAAVTTLDTLNFEARSALVNHGALAAGRDIALQSEGSLTNNGVILGDAGLLLSSGGPLTNHGDLVAVSGISLVSGSSLTNAGGVQSQGAVNFSASAVLTNSGNGLAESGASVGSLNMTGTSVRNSGNIAAGHDVALLATQGRLENSGTLTAQSVLTASAAGAVQNSGSMLALERLAVEGGSVENTGLISSAGTAQLVATNGALVQNGTISANSAIVLRSSGALTHGISAQTRLAEGDLTLQAGSAELAGVLQANGAIRATISNKLTIGGDLISGGSLTLSSDRLTVLGSGNLIANGAVSAETHLGLLQVAGDVLTNGTITLTSAADLVLASTAQVASAGTGRLMMTAGTDIAMGGKVLTAGNIVAAGDALTVSGDVDSGLGLVLTARTGDLVISGDANSTNSVITAVLGDVEITGKLAGVLVAKADGTFRNSGIITGESLAVSAEAIVNASAAEMTATDNLRLEAIGNIRNAGTISSDDQIELIAGGHLNNLNKVDAAGALRLEAGGGILNATGATYEGQIVSITSARLVNDGTIRSLTGLTADVSDQLLNRGRIEATGDLVLKIADLSNSGTITAIDGKLAVQDVKSFDNSDGTLSSNTGIIIQTSDRLTLGSRQWGKINSGGSLSLAGLNGGWLSSFSVAADQELVTIGNLSIRATTLNNAGTIASATGNLNLQGRLGIQNSGLLYAGGTLLSLRSRDEIINAGGVILAAQELLVCGVAAGGCDDPDTNRAGSLINRDGGIIETLAGDMVLAADIIQNRRELTLSEGGVIYNDRLGGEDYVDNGTNRWRWGFCHVDGHCGADYAYDESFALTLPAGSVPDSVRSPINLQFRHWIQEVTATGVGAESRIVSGGSIIFSAEDVLNRYAMISATQDIDFEAVNVTNEGAQTGRTISWMTTFLAGEMADGNYTRDADPLFTFQNAFGLIGTANNPTAVYTDFDPEGGSLGKLVAGETLTGDIRVARVMLRLDTEIGFRTPRGELLRFADMPFFVPDDNPNIVGWLNVEFELVENEDSWGDIRAPIYFLAGRDLYGTIEAGGAITGVISGTLDNGAVSANLNDLRASGSSDPSIVGLGANAVPTAGTSFTGAGHGGPDTGLTVDPDRAGAVVIGLQHVATIADLALAPSSLQLRPGTTGNVRAGEVDLSAIAYDQLFGIDKNPKSGTLISTRHDFIDLSGFTGSNYLLERVEVADNITERRLGDALVETYLIRDQLYELTGSRSLHPNLSEQAQIQRLYDNAVAEAERLGLTIGVPPTAEQISRLQESIVWLQERVVNGTRVLVPQVYVVDPAESRRERAGMTAGSNLDLTVGNVVNTGGRITAREQLRVDASGDISNTAGTLHSGGALRLSSGGVVANISGRISGDTVRIAADEIRMSTEVRRYADGQNVTETFGARALLSAKNSLTLLSKGDITLTGVQLRAGWDIQAVANGNIDLAAQQTDSSYSQRMQNWESASTRGLALTTDLTSGGAITLAAGYGLASDGQTLVPMDRPRPADGQASPAPRLVIEGSDITAKAAITLRATGNITLAAAAETESTSTSRRQRSLLSRSTTSSRTMDIVHQGATLTGGSLDINSGDDLTLLGTVMDIREQASLWAEGDLLVGIYEDVHTSDTRSRRTVLGGLMGSSSTHIITEIDRTPSSLLAGADLSLITDIGDITLQGTQLRSGGTLTISPGSGRLVLESVVDTREEQHYRSRNNGVITKVVSEASKTETATQVQIVAKSVDARDVDELVGNLSFPTEEAAKAYMGKMSQKFADARTTLNFSELEKTYSYDVSTSLSPAFRALLTVAVGNWLGAASFMEGIGLANAAGEAFMTSLIVGGLDGAVAGSLDLAELLEGATFSAVTAGLTSSINLDTFDINLGNAGSINLLGLNLPVSDLLEGWLDNTITSALSSVAYGTNFWNSLTAGMRGTLISVALADVQRQIGDLGLAEGSLGHAGLHALAGCIAAEAQGADCAAGGIAGALQSVYAGVLDANGTTLSDQEQQQRANLIGAIGGFVASGGEAENVSVAAQIAMSGMIHNRQMHRSEIVWLRENAAAFAAEQGISYDEALRRLTVQAASQVDSRYAGPVDDAAANFLFENAPGGVIPGTAGDGSYIDHNQTWFSSTRDQFNNHLINLASITFDPDIHLALEDFRAAGGGDPAVFVATRLLEGAPAYAFDDLSPPALLDTLATATAQFQAVLEGDYSPAQQLVFAEAYGFALNNAMSLRGFSPNQQAPEGFTEAEAAQLQAYYNLSIAVRTQLEPLLAVDGSRLSDDVAQDLLGTFRRNHLSQIEDLGSNVTSRLDDLIAGGQPLPSTGGSTRQIQMAGGFVQANADFDSLGLLNVRGIQMRDGGTGRVGSFPDGTTVVVRSGSSENRPGFTSQPTLEIQHPDGYIKLRY